MVEDDDAFEEIRLADGMVRARVRPAWAARACAGHFPGDPLLPGAALAGLMATVAARLVRGAPLVEIERCIFRARVHPESVLRVEAERAAGPETRVTVTARTGRRVAAHATLRFAAESSA